PRCAGAFAARGGGGGPGGRLGRGRGEGPAGAARAGREEGGERHQHGGWRRRRALSCLPHLDGGCAVKRISILTVAGTATALALLCLPPPPAAGRGLGDRVRIGLRNSLTQDIPAGPVPYAPRP